ncbi:methyltransferase-like protein 25 isoform X3 [Carcharodon carcharias]|uniref:methyltransferase-like protein 25 isoform X3 n=1 Tax=Carcharodon carcharias TaxID=13397 RepID=UPI001B7F185F|nr:methyltransferase-like protein 25 isoform X3 [Carcharodon carcharias]
MCDQPHSSDGGRGRSKVSSGESGEDGKRARDSVSRFNDIIIEIFYRLIGNLLHSPGFGALFPFRLICFGSQRPDPAATPFSHSMFFSTDVGLDLVKSKIKSLTKFLDVYLKIANVHTVDFYTKDVWNEFVALPPEAVISHLLCQQEGSTGPERMGASVWDQTQKLRDVAAYKRVTQDHSLPNLGVCTPLDDLLQEIWRENKKDMFLKTSTFMSSKKSHEVEVMSGVIACFAKCCNIQQVIDIGSGKGYLSSYLSMQYGLSVYGIDSSSTNTSGANERNRKLKRYWKVYQRQTKHLNQDSVPEHLDEKPMNNVESFKEIKEQIGHGGEQESGLLNQTGRVQPPVQTPISAISLESETNEEKSRDVSAQIVGSIEDQFNGAENLFLELLSTDAVEMSSLLRKKKDLDEKEKERRKTASLEAKAKRIKEANLYSPLTLHVTSTTELQDIISDIKDSMMVGLHTCGDLASDTLRIFMTKPELKAVCSVGCCYHLLSEEFELSGDSKECCQGPWGFPMSQYLRGNVWRCGRNARMSACLPLERVTVGHGLPSESLFYRAVLQVIIKEHFENGKAYTTLQRTNSKHVGKIYSKSSSFVDYTRKSVEKLGMDGSKISSICSILLMQTCAEFMRENKSPFRLLSRTSESPV